MYKQTDVITGLNTVSSWQQIHYNQFFHSHPEKYRQDQDHKANTGERILTLSASAMNLYKSAVVNEVPISDVTYIKH